MVAPLHNQLIKEKVINEMKKAYTTRDLFDRSVVRTCTCYIFYSKIINRWLILDGVGEIKQSANGYGYKTQESAWSAALYYDRENEQALKALEREARRCKTTDAELVQSYYGYDHCDFF